MKDLNWFREKTKEIEDLRESNKLTQRKGLEFDEQWWDNTCKIGLKKSMKEVLDTGISEPNFRKLMQEVFYFLQNFGTIEEAKQSGIYNPKIQTSDKEQ